jgi:hypothetical protein
VLSYDYTSELLNQGWAEWYGVPHEGHFYRRKLRDGSSAKMHSSSDEMLF